MLIDAKLKKEARIIF